MPTKKYEWNEYDRCAAASISHLMKAHGFSDRGMAAALENVISYNRVRDLRMALKAPVRLSEFLAICDVCHADPVATLREIIAEAERIQSGQQSPPAEPVSSPSDASVDVLYREARGTEPIDIDAWADRIKAEDSVVIHSRAHDAHDAA